MLRNNKGKPQMKFTTSENVENKINRLAMKNELSISKTINELVKLGLQSDENNGELGQHSLENVEIKTLLGVMHSILCKDYIQKNENGRTVLHRKQIKEREKANEQFRSFLDKN